MIFEKTFLKRYMLYVKMITKARRVGIAEERNYEMSYNRMKEVRRAIEARGGPGGGLRGEICGLSMKPYDRVIAP
jgi:hypothetical protein